MPRKRLRKKYDEKFDTISTRFPKKTIETHPEHGVESINAYLNKLIEAKIIK